ncbi:LysE family translocator [Massilia scottii]|uniref:LysE family translocator n=1 Tax=Massilia scottii TaxID=3057166 RepID=UPI0027967808|nr:LysE family translocator [Massilia sp. CCM 9029]MDQ1829929.1 LysE family translocator [Massilia sp. CCM 9029]
MNELTLIAGIAAALGLGAMSPGPSFIMVARTAVTASRTDGIAASVGMGIGGVLFAAIALLGLHVVLTNVPWLYMVLKAAGGAYLIYLGYRIWRGAAQPLALGQNDAPRQRRQLGKSFSLGLVTQLSNPKTAIVYAGVFTAFLPPSFSLTLALVLALVVFVIEAGWYVVVAIALSSQHPRAWYLRYKAWIDRAAGGVMAALGGKLIWSARSL